VFAENGDVISGGNFHGAPLALGLDFAAIALTDLMSISERRIERMVNPDLSDGLPAFLARKPGLQSGMMIAQVAAASLLNKAKVLAHPASVDNVPTSAGKEDHVSMGMTSAVKLRSIVENAENLLAIELLVGAEALEHRRPLKAVAVRGGQETRRRAGLRPWRLRHARATVFPGGGCASLASAMLGHIVCSRWHCARRVHRPPLPQVAHRHVRSAT